MVNPIPQGQYRPAVRYENLVFSAGMTPRKDGVLLMSGKVKRETSVETYRVAVQQATDNALTAIRNTLIQEEKIQQILSLTVYVNGEEGYTAHSKLGDLASDYLYDQLGDGGIGARAAIGVVSLPGNAPIEIQIVAAVSKTIEDS